MASKLKVELKHDPKASNGTGAYDARLKASTADLAEKFRHLDNYLGYK